VLLILAGALALSVFVRRIYGFLALTQPQPGAVLVVEGWVQDFALKEAVAEYRRHPNGPVYVTGGPFEVGAPLLAYRTSAELGAARLIKLGLGTNEVQAIPYPSAGQDRTFTSALMLEKWWREHGLSATRMNLLTLGPHARRSRLLFQKAFGKHVTVGVIAIAPRDYDPAHWWRTSQGFRIVTDETMAYIYARLFFRPLKQVPPEAAGPPAPPPPSPGR
jgi:hypothetical protein